MSLSPAVPVETATGGRRRTGVMVVDDSAVVRGLMSRWVEEDPNLSIVGKFSNGQLALDALDRCDPDVIVLDVEMPVMDGMTALPKLLERKPGVKIIMASTLTRRNAEISLRALSLGAFDCVTKPESNSGVTTSPKFREELIAKIRHIGGAGIAWRARRAAAPAAGYHPATPPGTAISLRPFSAVRPRVLAIGSSTGGPKVLSQIIAGIAGVIPSIPVLVAQHMPPTFTSILAEHLSRDSGLKAKEAEDREPLLPGVIYVAPGGRHMGLAFNGEAAMLNVYDGPEVNFCKPAVDPLFQSVANVFGAAALALVLTGMGHDGTAGAIHVADAGGSVIAQDRASSVVWGMPGSAAAAGACAAVLPVDRMIRKTVELVRGAPA